MTKAELLREYCTLCDKKRFTIDGIYANSNKAVIQNAIDCLNCSDETMQDYLTVVKVRYPAIHRTIVDNGNFLTHRFNRIFVYDTARLVLNH